ncbi:MAG: shikimate dehydrogenase [Cyanobacteriota bacterium]|nr:shikimate dehydrogenase [Cyanobacteriota bacterium]
MQQPTLQQITGKTKLLGVIGDPVEHSLSPAMHNAAIADLNLDYAYLPFPIAAENLETAIAGFAAIGLVGFNITIPHKQTIMPFLAEISPVARAVGAVNTVWRSEKGWEGTNTDVEGFLAPLKTLNRDWTQTVAVVLGNGGAARAVVAGAAQLGCREVRVVGRNREKLDRFAASWQNSPIEVNLKPYRADAVAEAVSGATLLVNATPVGMSPHVDRSPFETALFAKLAADAIAYDLIYTPSPTQFLREAQQVGITAIDGAEMLVCQGAAALEKWLQQPVPVAVMRQALRAGLDGRGR